MFPYSVKKDLLTGEEFLEIPFKGIHLLKYPLLNKGVAFTYQERRNLGLLGLLPHLIGTIDTQAHRMYQNFLKEPDDLKKYTYMLNLLDTNETLFYRVVLDHLDEMLPIIYTPTVGRACQLMSHILRRTRGIYITPETIDSIDMIFSNVTRPQVNLIVATDGERILGLGDLGSNGMGIPIGKISLYVAAAGINPTVALPVMLDVGTNNEALLSDPLYLGYRKPRLHGEAYDVFLEQFVTAVRRYFPIALLQWEDFAKHNAFRLLEVYRDRIASFNDDIQGTGAVALAALVSAMRAKRETFSEQRFVLFGFGQAGSGIARNILTALEAEGLTRSEALAHIFAVDREGLLVEGYPGIGDHQELFVHDRSIIADWKIDNPARISLEDVLRNGRATVLVGTSAMPGRFDETVIQRLMQHTDRPVLFALSNPTSKCECVPSLFYKQTAGRGLMAVGSPFPPVHVNGRELVVSQGNNLYIFPGVGLGAMVSGALKVTDRMLLVGSYAVSALMTDEEIGNGNLLPPLANIRRVSLEVAVAVAIEARESGIGMRASDDEIRARIEQAMWYPEYLPYRYNPALQHSYE